MMPKMHLLAAVVAPRGNGKGVITTNLIQQLTVVDRLILVSPSAASNKVLLAKEDMFDNPNDISVLDKIVAIVEKERDDYEDADGGVGTAISSANNQRVRSPGFLCCLQMM